MTNHSAVGVAEGGSRRWDGRQRLKQDQSDTSHWLCRRCSTGTVLHRSRASEEMPAVTARFIASCGSGRLTPPPPHSRGSLTVTYVRGDTSVREKMWVPAPISWALLPHVWRREDARLLAHACVTLTAVKRDFWVREDKSGQVRLVQSRCSYSLLSCTKPGCSRVETSFTCSEKTPSPSPRRPPHLPRLPHCARPAAPEEPAAARQQAADKSHSFPAVSV